MMVAGIDLSTNAIDLVAIHEDNPARCQHLHIPLTKGTHTWWDDARHMHATLAYGHGATSWLYNRNVSLCGIERPYGPNRQSIASLHTILGAVLASLPTFVKAFEVTPADMRRELGLAGNCGKEQVQLAVRRAVWEEPWPEENTDAIDAWAAAHAALRINERGTPMEAA